MRAILANAPITLDACAERIPLWDQFLTALIAKVKFLQEA
jgi:hypothetical protein